MFKIDEEVIIIEDDNPAFVGQVAKIIDALVIEYPVSEYIYTVEFVSVVRKSWTSVTTDFNSPENTLVEKIRRDYKTSQMIRHTYTNRLIYG